MTGVVYHGTLVGVTYADGTYDQLPALILASVPGVGLVTALTRDDLREGRFVAARGVPRRVGKVWYRRRRVGYAASLWFHNVAQTAVVKSGNAVSFVALGTPARVCERPPGDFICGG